MAPYTQNTLIGIVVLLGVGVVGSLIGILWFRITSRAPLEKDTILFIIKLFGAISVALIIVMLIYRYA